MKHPKLSRQSPGAIHTPAIGDCGAPSAQTRATVDLSGSTAQCKAVHTCGAPALRPCICAVSRDGGRS